MLLRQLFEDKWWDDTDVIRLYHGTSSALVPLIQQEGLLPPAKQLEEWALDILELYIPRDQWTDELVTKVKQRCARTGSGRAGDAGQVIFCMADFEGPAGYARSYAEHGGEIAKDVYETAAMHVLGQTHDLDEIGWMEYQALERPFPPRFSGSKPVVVEILVPKDWCLFYLNLEHTKAGVQKARDEGRRWAIEQSLEQTYDEIFDNKEVRIAQTVPPSMVVAIHDASEKLNEYVTEDNLRNLLKRFDNTKDHNNGTMGFCGTFALSLYRYLKKQGEQPKLLASFLDGNDGVHWTHVFVELHGRFWDVTGEIDIDSDQFKYWYEAEGIRELSEAEVLRMVSERRLRKHSYSHRLKTDWMNRLNESVSIDDIPLSVKQDIIDMLLVNCPPFEKWWMAHHGIMSFSQDYVSQCIFGTEDLENSTSEGYGDEQPFRVEAITLPLNKLQGKASVSDHVVGQYAALTSKAPPILVRKTSRGWKVVEGGHRYAAAVKRGDKSIRAYDVTAFFTFDYSKL